MNANSDKLSPATTGFALAAAVAILFNTALAWAKDAYAPLNAWLKSLTGHHWTTHGLFDLAIFIVLGFVFTNSKIGANMDSKRLTGALTLAVTVAALGLMLWYVFF
jgi:multisubunit Na+/H+ antiporter MnhB subunit